MTQMLVSSGYSDICCLLGQWCAIRKFSFTTAVVVGLDDVGYQRRYCYEHADEARTALRIWDGHDHPSGPWIKCKGGGIDLLNPAFR